MRTLVRGVVIVVLSLFSLSMYAALSQKYVDFGKSPAKWLMTRDEQKKWKSVSTDEQAQEFIDLFWARRDPTPGTYVNEYKQEYDARVKYAKENYSHRQVSGELSDRGHAVIVLPIIVKVAGVGGWLHPLPTLGHRLAVGLSSPLAVRHKVEPFICRHVLPLEMDDRLIAHRCVLPLARHPAERGLNAPRVVASAPTSSRDGFDRAQAGAPSHPPQTSQHHRAGHSGIVPMTRLLR